MALGGSVKQTRTAGALGLRERCYLHGGSSRPFGKAHRPFAAQGKQECLCHLEAATVDGVYSRRAASFSHRFGLMHFKRKGGNDSPSNPSTLPKLTGVRGSDILLVSDYTAKEY